MVLAVASRGRGTDRSASVGDLGSSVLKVLQDAADARLEEGPATSVLGLFLAPNNFGVLVVLGHFSAEGVEGEGRQLFNSHDGDVILLQLFSLSLQVIIDLTRAENDLLNLLVVDLIILLGNDALELSATQEILHFRMDFPHFKHLFGRNNNEGLAEWTQHLSAQHVEVLGGSRAVDNLNVALFVQILSGLSDGGIIRVRKLQVTLNTAAGMLGTITIVTMRQKHNQTVFDVPLSFTRGNELIDHGLGSIGEITELGLPQGQGVGQSLGITVLEAQDGVLRQVRATGNEVTAFITALLLGLQDRAVMTISVLVENVSVSVREGTSLDILTRETNVITLVDQGSESQSFSLTPINTLFVLNCGNSVLEDLNNIIVEFTVGRQDRDLHTNLGESLLIDTGQSGEIIILDLSPLLGHPLFLLILQIFALGVGLFHLGSAVSFDFLEIGLSNTLLNKLCAVDISDRLVLLNDFVHEWLGEGRLIELIVSVLAVTN